MGFGEWSGLRVDPPCAGCGTTNLWRSEHGPWCLFNMWRKKELMDEDKPALSVEEFVKKYAAYNLDRADALRSDLLDMLEEWYDDGYEKGAGR